jgi:hypothetical protein
MSRQALWSAALLRRFIFFDYDCDNNKINSIFAAAIPLSSMILKRKRTCALQSASRKKKRLSEHVLTLIKTA